MRCLANNWEIMKWLTSSSAQYARWLAMLAMREMSRKLLKVTPSLVTPRNVSYVEKKGDSRRTLE